MDLFTDLKNGFAAITSDRWWWAKILFGGFLLINPALLVLGPMAFLPDPEPWIKPPDWATPVFFGVLFFNVLTFWIPLGFTFEVLRRARTGSAPQLPSWGFAHWRTYIQEGAVKLVLAITTLLLPVGLWVFGCYVLFIHVLGLPAFVLGLAYVPGLWFAIPFCGVACCRWLDGATVADCALNYVANGRIFARRGGEFLIASTFLTGLNAVACSLWYTIPFAAVFGLCLVDTWFGPIYADAAAQRPRTLPIPEPGSETQPIVPPPPRPSALRGQAAAHPPRAAAPRAATQQVDLSQDELDMIKKYIRR